MQTIFQLEANELNEQFVQRLRTFYAGHKVKITVEEEAIPVSMSGLMATPTSIIPTAYQPPRTPQDAEVNSLTSSLLFGRS
ncbi:hypothetical protein J2I47_07095 [Fibrella sp. HMF5335]|uniref:Uncharacterized protein n=1 Tax=Fibrella rubiginis TaxID=2817060 RepID=A0A939K5C3_9BACT|nr:hypothetical protein [Fibrella rubiginis]MBO0936310.1 hypothetical protein [Fibrella rubiginis]